MPNILITGASKGIGKATAEKFAKKGYDLAICSRNQDEIEAVAQAISEKYNNKVFAMEVDVCELEELKNFVEKSSQKLGFIEVLVNNAGLFIPGQIHEEQDGILEEMIETNLYSAYRLSKLLIPSMIKQNKGHIFNICSTASITAYDNGGSYCISKFAMYGMSKVLRQELKDKGIKVTSILPGATFTNSWEGTELPRERFMEAKDVAEAIYLASKMSKSAVIEDIIMRPQAGDL